MLGYRKLSLWQLLGAIRRRRRLARDSRLETELHRCLNVVHLTMYGISSTIGVGLYVLSGTLIRNKAGPLAAFAFLVAGISSVFTAVCYAEFATLIPRAGSAYSYTYLMLGELPAFVIGWTMISDILVGMSAIAKAFSGTINTLSNDAVRNFSITHFGRLPDSDILEEQPDLLAFLFIFLLLLVALIGARGSLTCNAVFSSIQLLFLLIVVGAAFSFGDAQNFQVNGGFAPFGAKGLFNAAGLAVFAFAGFEALANATEEAANPRRDIPRALFISLGVCMATYFVATLSLSNLVPWPEVDLHAPFPEGFRRLGLNSWMIFASVTSLLATSATKIVSMHVIPRVMYSMACDGLFFQAFAYVEPRTKVPLLGLFTGGFISMLMAMFFNIRVLSDFTSIGCIFCYLFIGIDLMVLRYLYQPDDQQAEGMTTYSKNSVAYEEFRSDEPPFTLDRSDVICLEGPQQLPLRLNGTFQKRLIAHLPSWTFSTTGFIMHLCVFLAAQLCLSLTINYGAAAGVTWSYAFIVIFVILAVMSFCVLALFKPKKYPDAYETRLMPLCPCVTMAANSILILALPGGTWIRFFVWNAIGLVIYFGYGLWHSRVDEGNSEAEKTEHQRT